MISKLRFHQGAMFNYSTEYSESITDWFILKLPNITFCFKAVAFIQIVTLNRNPPSQVVERQQEASSSVGLGQRLFQSLLSRWEKLDGKVCHRFCLEKIGKFCCESCLKVWFSTGKLVSNHERPKFNLIKFNLIDPFSFFRFKGFAGAPCENLSIAKDVHRSFSDSRHRGNIEHLGN